MGEKYDVAIINPYSISNRTAEESLALGYLVSVLETVGYKVLVVDAWLGGMGLEDVMRVVDNDGRIPPIVCFSCYRSNLIQAREILHRLVCQFGKFVSVCGGYGPTFHDEEFLAAGFEIGRAHV